MGPVALSPLAFRRPCNFAAHYHGAGAPLRGSPPTWGARGRPEPGGARGDDGAFRPPSPRCRCRCRRGGAGRLEDGRGGGGGGGGGAGARRGGAGRGAPSGSAVQPIGSHPRGGRVPSRHGGTNRKKRRGREGAWPPPTPGRAPERSPRAGPGPAAAAAPHGARAAARRLRTAAAAARRPPPPRPPPPPARERRGPAGTGGRRRMTATKLSPAVE